MLTFNACLRNFLMNFDFVRSFRDVFHEEVFPTRTDCQMRIQEILLQIRILSGYIRILSLCILYIYICRYIGVFSFGRRSIEVDDTNASLRRSKCTYTDWLSLSPSLSVPLSFRRESARRVTSLFEFLEDESVRAYVCMNLTKQRMIYRASYYFFRRRW